MRRPDALKGPVRVRATAVRASAFAFALVLGGMLTGCASATSPAEKPAPLAGTWLGETELEPGFFSPAVLHLSDTPDGGIAGTVDLLAGADYGVPIEHGSRRGNSLSLETTRARFQGELGAGGREMQGSVKQRSVVGRLFAWAFGEKSERAFVMRRTDPGALPQRPDSRTYERDGHVIHYVEVTASAAARVVFIHGSPGEWSDFGTFLVDADLQRRATLVSVDRPGFGESEPGQVVPDLHEQARLLEPLLHAGPAAGNGDPRAPAARAPSRRIPTLVVGWSEGGPIAAELAMDYPDEVQQAILIAPAIDPANDGAQWYNRAVTHWPLGGLVSWAMGPEMLWSNAEIMQLGPQLLRMEPRWKTLAVPVTVIQGTEDSLVDPRTADFATRVLPAGGRVIRVPGAGHVNGWGKTARDTLISLLDAKGPPSAR